MDKKRFIGAILAVFVAIQITDPIIHNLILGKTYMTLQSVWRVDMMSKMWIMFINYIVFSSLFVYIFSKGFEKKGVLEGIRYGILIGFFVYVFSVINQYVIYPIPFSMILLWCFFGLIQYTLYGIITALIFKVK